MNIATIAGIIQHTPKVRNTRQGGERVLNLDVSVRQRAKKDGQWVNETVYFDVTLFGSRADGLGGILKKGSQVGVTGELRVRRYTGRDQTEKFAFEIVASNIWPLDWTRREEQQREDSGEFRAQHRDELAGDRTESGESVRGQQQLRSEQRKWEAQERAFNAAAPPEDDDIPF